MMLRALIVLLMLLAASRSAEAADYALPVGIPTPSFGLNNTQPSAPASWSGGSPSATANNYYVDLATGSDTANTYGHPGAPRLTVPTTLSAGAYVEVHGNAAMTSTISWTINGTAESPVWVVGISSPTWTSSGADREFRVSGTYGIIKGITFVRAAWVWGVTGTSAQYMGMHDVEISGIQSSNGAVVSALAQPIDAGSNNLVHLRCSVHNNGDTVPLSAEADMHAFKAGNTSHAHHLWFLEWDTHDNSGDSVQVGSATPAPDDQWPEHIYVGNSTSYNEGENAYDFKLARKIVVSNCEGSGYQTVPGSSGGEAFVLHYGTEDVWVINNKFRDCVRGIVSTGAGIVYIVGNQVWDMSDYGMYLDRGNGTFHVFNNTLVRTVGGGIVSTGTIQEMNCRNNIVFNAGGNYLGLANSTARAASAVSNELYFEEGGSIAISWGSTYTTVAAWIAGTTVGDNSLEVDPELVSAATDDFNLLSTSDARNAGYDWQSALDTAFNTTFGITPDWADRTGTLLDASPDIGAYQFVEAATPRISGGVTVSGGASFQ